jgi:hypothetical protein
MQPPDLEFIEQYEFVDLFRAHLARPAAPQPTVQIDLNSRRLQGLLLIRGQGPDDQGIHGSHRGAVRADAPRSAEPGAERSPFQSRQPAPRPILPALSRCAHSAT